MSPNAHFTGPVGGQLADIDISTTNVAGVAGFIYRPRLGDKVVLLTQADIGGGSAFTWSARGGVEFLIKPWIGLAVGYNALHIDTGNVPKSGSGPVNDLQYARDAVRSRVLDDVSLERKMKCRSRLRHTSCLKARSCHGKTSFRGFDTYFKEPMTA